MKNKAQGEFRIVQGVRIPSKFEEDLSNLADGDYGYYVENIKKNTFLPYSNYLFSVVLPYISENLSDHPEKKALYKFFEDTYAPRHVAYIGGEEYEWVDLKTEKKIYVQDFIEKILKHAKKFWHIEVPQLEEFSKPEQFECKAQAAIATEVDWARFISNKQNSDKLNKDERRNQEN